MDDDTSARFFLTEVAAMLADPRPDNRRIKLGPGAAPRSRTVAAFVVTGPEPINATNTTEWLHERYVKDSDRQGQDFLTSALRTVTPGPAKDLIYLGAGPGRYVVITALPKTLDKINDYTFIDAGAALGSGWHTEPLYAAVDQAALTNHLDHEHVDPNEPLGRRILTAAARSAAEA